MEIINNNQQQNANVVQTKDELLKALQSDFATGVTKVYINSLKTEVAFKEITVNQQKTLSRILIGNEQRKDIIYDAQCAIINTAALAENFDIYNLTEFDRLKILIALYQANVFNNDIQFTCKYCGTENKYAADFDSTLRKLDAIELTEKILKYDNKNFTFEFKLAYPNVKKISNFYKQYYLKHKSQSKRDAELNDNFSQIEYINLFIQDVTITIKTNNTTRYINFNDYKPTDIEDIISQFPQDVLYTDNGVLTYITNEFIKQINDSFDKHVCYNCNMAQEQEDSDQIHNFL